MGLVIDVFRAARGDCSNGGISSRFDRLTVVNIDGPFEPTDDAPAVYLVPHRTMKGVCFLVDEDGYKGNRWPMAGGNYGATSDSRFNDAVSRLIGSPWHGAVKIHDRHE